MYITNVTGSSRFSKPNSTYGNSWLNYWERQIDFFLAKDKYYKCPICGNPYLRENFDGAHVQKVSSLDKHWYIIPICDSCNHKNWKFDINQDLLVPVPSNL